MSDRVLVCPECDASEIEVRSGDQSPGSWYCKKCHIYFERPRRRLPHPHTEATGEVEACPHCDSCHVNNREIGGWICYKCREEFEAPTIRPPHDTRNNAGSALTAKLAKMNPDEIGANR